MECPITLMESGAFQELTGNTPGAAQNCLAATFHSTDLPAFAQRPPARRWQMGLRVKAPGWAVAGQDHRDRRKPGAASQRLCHTPRALFLLQEVHKTAPTRLNIISTSLHGEF